MKEKQKQVVDTTLKGNLVQVFENQLFGKIRVVINEEVQQPVFNLLDIGYALGYCKDVTSKGKTYNQLRKDRLANISDNLDIQWLPHNGQTFLPITKDTDFENAYVTEDALYDFIFESKASGARKFRKWVTSEVLPSIRQHGAYLTPEVMRKLKENPNYIVELVDQLEQFKLENKNLKLDLEESEKANQIVTKQLNNANTMWAACTNEIKDFADTQLIYKKSAKVRKADVYNAYCRWYRKTGQEPREASTFYDELPNWRVDGKPITEDGNYYKNIEVRK